jgi:chaperone modulatory protein CbpM
MISEQELVDSIDELSTDTLHHWIALGWVLPTLAETPKAFDPSDIARVHLICDLYYHLQIDEGSMSVVLSLLDQLYSSRTALHRLVSAIEAQPDAVRCCIATLVAGAA